jgi:cobalamin biosynthesis Mg chelatase CobN
MFLLVAGTARADEPFLNVDGNVYSPTQISGPTRHYETPDIDPTSAFSDRHVWTGNGSEHLPCPNGIHWIDNESVLTISHCLDGSTTTTTAPSMTSSSMPSTSSSMATTSSTMASTTTSVDQSTTSTDQSTTTSVDQSTTSSADQSTTSTDPGTSTTGQAPNTDATVSPTVVTSAPGEVDDEELPFTGFDSSVMVGLAVLLTAVGAALLALTRRVENN